MLLGPPPWRPPGAPYASRRHRSRVGARWPALSPRHSPALLPCLPPLFRPLSLCLREGPCWPCRQTMRCLRDLVRLGVLRQRLGVAKGRLLSVGEHRRCRARAHGLASPCKLSPGSGMPRVWYALAASCWRGQYRGWYRGRCLSYWGGCWGCCPRRTSNRHIGRDWHCRGATPPPRNPLTGCRRRTSCGGWNGGGGSSSLAVLRGPLCACC